MADQPSRESGLPEYLRGRCESFIIQIPKALWPLYEGGEEDCGGEEDSRFNIEYSYEITGPNGGPMQTSLGIEYLPKEAERPSFGKGRTVTLNGVDLLVVSAKVSEETREETGEPLTWFSVQVDLPRILKENASG